MAKPIELGLRLEGDDAKAFWENEKKPATQEQIQMFRDAKKIYSRFRF